MIYPVIKQPNFSPVCVGPIRFQNAIAYARFSLHCSDEVVTRRAAIPLGRMYLRRVKTIQST